MGVHRDHDGDTNTNHTSATLQFPGDLFLRNTVPLQVQEEEPLRQGAEVQPL